MGKPFSQGLKEIATITDRVEHLTTMAREVLQDDVIKVDAQNYVKIKKEPVGISMMISPWNYPLNTVINSLICSILCGNPVLLKHSVRTPVIGDFFAEAFKEAGASNVVQHLFLDAKDIPLLYKENWVNFVGFTGSLETGRAVQKDIANSGKFLHSVFELGGKDPAYVREDADIDFAVASLVDGALYNTGQGCCSIERVYVHEKVHDEFIHKAIKEIQNYRFGNPMGLDENSDIKKRDFPELGPMALPDSLIHMREQVEQAGENGAEIIMGGNITRDDKGLGRFFQPTLIINCDNSMNIMQQETFGPIMPISKVTNDNQAVELMNDSSFGLTAGVYTKDYSTAEKLVSKINAGTVYMNRCDSLHPYLPWSGRKHSGVGIGLSKYGFNAFYRTKGYNFNLPK